MKEICKNSNQIIVDFYIKINDKIYIIEYNGIQHYEYIPFFHKQNIENFDKQLNRDRILIEYCTNNNINLIQIKYNLNKTEIMNELINTFLNNE